MEVKESSIVIGYRDPMKVMSRAMDHIRQWISMRDREDYESRAVLHSAHNLLAGIHTEIFYAQNPEYRPAKDEVSA